MPRKNRKREAFVQKYRDHIGHRVTLNNGEIGTLVRVSDDGEFIWCWIRKGEWFLDRHDTMEMKDCECYHKEKTK